MTVDKKNIVIIILFIIVVIFGYIAFKPAGTNLNEELLQHEVKRLNDENISLVRSMKARDIKIAGLQHKNDSLESTKPLIHKTYEKKAKQIDSASANVILDEFKNVFSNAGIK